MKAFLPFYGLLLIIGISSRGDLMAQGSFLIKGRVIDKSNDEPIPFATVYLDGRKILTQTDENGNYLLQTKELRDTIFVTSIGYEKGIKLLKKLPVQNINFYLERAQLTFDEIVIKPGEDPVKLLLRKVIAAKPDNNAKSGLETYSYEAYNKIEIDMYDWDKRFEDSRIMRPFSFVFDYVDTTGEEEPFLPIFLSESISQNYYRSNPKDQVELIQASRMSGIKNESMTQYLGSMYQEVNIYDNWPYLMYVGFVSPIADNGNQYYQYFLTDTVVIEGYTCYQLTFQPKSKGSNTFIGDIWIADSSWAVKRVSMEVADHVQINFVEKVSFHQEFEMSDGKWMVSKDKVSIKFKPAEKVLGAIGRKTTIYKDYVINDPAVNQYLKGGDDIIVSQDVIVEDDVFWQDHRPEDLSKSEDKIYEMVDSLTNVKAFKNWKAIFKSAYSGFLTLGPVKIGSLWGLYSQNSVENHRFKFGLYTSNKLSKTIAGGGYIAYGLGDKRFKYGAEGTWIIKKDPRKSLEFNYQNDLDLVAQSEADVGQSSLLAGLFRKKGVPQKLAYLHQFQAQYHHEWPIGFSYQAGMKVADLQPLFSMYYLKEREKEYDTLRRVQTAELNFKLRFAYREKFLSGDFERVSMGSPKPIIELRYAYGIPDLLGADFTYHKFNISVRDKLPINPIGNLYYTFIGGKVFGQLPFTSLVVHPGNETYFLNKYAFNLMNEYEFVSDLYASLILTHHLEGFFIKKIPYIRKSGLRGIVSFKGVMGTMTQQNREANALNRFIVPNKKPYLEAGFGIENILKLIRLDAVWRLTYRDVSLAHNFGIMVGLELSF